MATSSDPSAPPNTSSTAPSIQGEPAIASNGSSAAIASPLPTTTGLQP